MSGLGVVVVVGLLVIVGDRVARWVRLPSPLVALAVAALVGLAPGWSPPELPPDVVLLLFLPALLYWEALTTSWREVRANLRAIISFATVLVVVTAAAVAAVGHALGLAWPMAWVLGAALAPTDATAVSAVATGLPRRQQTTLKAESLVNDGTALVLYGIAVGVATGHASFSLPRAGGDLALSCAGGVAIGGLTAVAAMLLRRLVRTGVPGDEEAARLENVVSVLTPFLAYLPAELLGSSGVVSVVTCGLLAVRSGPSQIGAAARFQAVAFWELTTFVLNAALFVLIGLQLRSLVAGLSTAGVLLGVAEGVVVAVTITGTRLVFVNVLTAVIRLLDRRPSQRARRAGWRVRLVSGWSGFRGAVSLAAALAVPLTSADGSPLPGRQRVLLITFVAIAVILLVQGPTLPALVRWAGIPPDDDASRELARAERHVMQAGLEEIDRRGRAATDPSLVRQVRAEHVARRGRPHRRPAGADPATGPDGDEGGDGEIELRTAVVAAQRSALVGMRDESTIDDITLRQVQARLDLEELGIAALARATSRGAPAGPGPEAP